MQAESHKKDETDAQNLRRSAGRWLKHKREERNLSQRQLSEILGFEYYTFVSQLETGRGRIPPDRYADWARALGMEPREFVYVLMRYYDPITFSILFPDDEKDPSLKKIG